MSSKNGELHRLLQSARRVVLTTHRSPDGDGVGSEVGLARMLAAAGAEVRIINVDPLPRLLTFLDTAFRVETYEPQVHDAVLAAADVIVMLDNSVAARMGRMEPVVRRAAASKACIDHHPDPDSYWNPCLVDTGACCTGQLIHALGEALGWSIDPPAAEALYTALVSDTGRFRFANTSPEAFRMAAALVERGARPARIYARLEEQYSEGFLRMYGEVLAGMESRCEGRLLLLRIPLAMIERHGAAGEDLSEIINQSLGHRESRLAVLFRELEDGQTKISLRSKGARDVNRLARRHGGGGHRNASGIVLPQPLEAAVTLLLPELEALATEEESPPGPSPA
ncbi:MAG: DHH family phosphoesterase [Acidobacteriota bacterium]|nr:DHH family phosphoesterase [Acidobacteriota bacterium]MDQ7086397.1 DHH family phosphoesterase [Acidobacteriota bacterium]